MEWCDVAYNNAYGTKDRRTGDAQSKPVICIMPDGKEYWFKGMMQASRVLGIQPANGWKVVAGIRDHTCGYKFYKY